MQEALKERLINAAWNLQLFERANCADQYSYLLGMAKADLQVALDIAKELDSDVA